VDPKDLVERMLEDDDRDRYDDEPRDGSLVYATIYPIGEEDVDLVIRYHASKAHPDDSGYRPGAYHVEIEEIVRDDTKEDITRKLTQDQFYELQEKVSEHFHHYVR